MFIPDSWLRLWEDLPVPGSTLRERRDMAVRCWCALPEYERQVALIIDRPPVQT